MLNDELVPEVWTTFTATESIGGSVKGTAFLDLFTGQEHHFRPDDIHLDYWALSGPDMTEDERADFLIPYLDGQERGVTIVARNSWISADGHEISLSGGTRLIELDLPPSARFFLYRLLVSSSGTGPMSVQGVQVPLTYDLQVVQSYLGQLPPVTNAFSGILDQNGDASASIDVVPGSLPSSLAGRTIWVAGIAGPPWQWYVSTGYWWFQFVL